MMGVVLAAALAVVASAAPPPATINATFDSFLLDGLKAARTNWAPDACLSSAQVLFTPGGEFMPGARLAGGEFYEFTFDSSSTPNEIYDYRSPLQVSGDGHVADEDLRPKKALGTPMGPPRCIMSLPVTLLQAYQTAVASGYVLDDSDRHIRVIFALDDFSNSRQSSASLLGRALAPLGRTVWAFATTYTVHTIEDDAAVAVSDIGEKVESLTAVDAQHGGRIKVPVVTGSKPARRISAQPHASDDP